MNRGFQFPPATMKSLSDSFLKKGMDRNLKDHEFNLQDTKSSKETKPEENKQL